MAVRFVALLIPLAITLPQLRMNLDAAPAPQEQAVQTPPSSAPEWTYPTRRAIDSGFTRVALESPLHGALGTIDSSATGPALPAARKATAAQKRSAPKAAASAKTSMRPGARKAQRPPLQAACPAATHCAPVVQAKITAVSRRSM